MKKHWMLYLLVSLALVAKAEAATPLWLPNLSGNATGTNVGGKDALDVNITNALSFEEQATAEDGDPAPSLGKVIMGVDNLGNAQFVLTDTDGTLETNRTWTLSSGSDSVSAAQSGTWNVTNISGTVSLPTGAATAARQDTGNTSLGSIDSKLPTLASGRVPVDGSGVTQPVSATSLPLPTGAATAAKQPALGTAGTASSDVITVQGVASMTPLLVNGSGVTQPVSGTVSAAQSGTWTVQPGNTANTTAWLVAQAAPAAKTVKQAVISVGTSAVRATTDGSAVTAGRVYLSFRRDDASTGVCYWGSSSVTSSSGTRGLLIYPGESVERVNDAGEYYLICDGAAQTFYVVEQE